MEPLTITYNLSEFTLLILASIASRELIVKKELFRAPAKQRHLSAKLA